MRSALHGVAVGVEGSARRLLPAEPGGASQSLRPTRSSRSASSVRIRTIPSAIISSSIGVDRGPRRRPRPRRIAPMSDATVGFPARERIQHGQPEPLVERRIRDRVRVPVEHVEAGASTEPEPGRGAIGTRRRSRPAALPGATRRDPPARDHGGATPRPASAIRPHEPRQVLARLDRPDDEQERRGGLEPSARGLGEGVVALHRPDCRRRERRDAQPVRLYAAGPRAPRRRAATA